VKTTDLLEYFCDKMVGPVPENGFESDGMTGCPDVIAGVDCRPAALFHDYAYTIGGDENDRWKADRDFCVNLLLCGLPHALADVAYRRVRLWGISHFRYDVPPRRLYRACLYIRCFFTRYWI